MPIGHPLQAGDADLPEELQFPADASLESCDEESLQPSLAGDPEQLQQLLEQFAARMAEHGRSVRCGLMRTDRAYALWQIARARATDDADLRSVAVRLFALWADGQARRS